MPGQPNPTETSGLPAPARVWKRLAVNCTVPEIQGFPRVLADGAHFLMAIEVGSIFEFGGGCAVQASAHSALGGGWGCAAVLSAIHRLRSDCQPLRGGQLSSLKMAMVQRNK